MPAFPVGPLDRAYDNGPVQAGDLLFHSNTPEALAVPRGVREALCTQVDAGVRALRHGGAEIGGLLVALNNPDGPVTVEETVAIPLQYRFGPSFRLSASDFEFLERAIATIQSHKDRTVVGCYRSWIRGDVRLRDSDFELFSAIERFCKSYADFRFFMVLTPVSRREVTVEVAVLHEGTWDNWDSCKVPALPTTSLIAVPPPVVLPAPVPPPASQPEPLSPAAASAPALAPAPTPPPAPPPPPEPLALAPAPAPHAVAPEPTPGPAIPPRRRVPAWVYVAAGFSLLAAAAWTYGWMRVRQTAPPPQVSAPATLAGAGTGFSARLEGALWKLTWNRDAVAAMRAEAAVLSIQDGDDHQRIPLAKADLSAGAVFYSPRSRDLLFGLTVQVPGTQPVEEQIRVLAPVRASADPPPTSSGPATRPVQAPGSAATIVGADRQVRVLRPFTEPVASATGAPPNPATPTEALLPPALPPPGDGAVGRTGAAGALLFQAPAAPPRRPEIAMVPAPVPAPLLSTPVSIPSSAPASQNPAAATPPAPKNVAPPPAAGGSAARPAQPPVAAVNSVAPKPIHKVRASAIAAAGEPTTFQVQVGIDATGKVVKVEPLGLNAVNFRLAHAAIVAARAWRFEPARENGRAVPGEATLTFQFSRK
jgi:hypothetical protein